MSKQLSGFYMTVVLNVMPYETEIAAAAIRARLNIEMDYRQLSATLRGLAHRGLVRFVPPSMRKCEETARSPWDGMMAGKWVRLDKTHTERDARKARAQEGN